MCCVPGSAFTVVSRTSMNDWMQKTHTEWLIDRNVIQGNVDLVTWSTRVNHVALWMCVMLAVDTHNGINTLLHEIVGDVEWWIFPAGGAYLPFWFWWRGWRRCRLALRFGKALVFGHVQRYWFVSLRFRLVSVILHPGR